MIDSFKFNHDMKCLREKINQANYFYYPHLRDVVMWLKHYDEELRKYGINVNFDRQLGFNYRTILSKEDARVKNAEKAYEDLKNGRITSHRQETLDRAYYALLKQRDYVFGCIYQIEDVRYDIEERYGRNALKAAAKADAISGYYHDNSGADIDICIEGIEEEIIDLWHEAPT